MPAWIVVLDKYPRSNFAIQMDLSLKWHPFLSPQFAWAWPIDFPEMDHLWLHSTYSTVLWKRWHRKRSICCTIWAETQQTLKCSSIIAIIGHFMAELNPSEGERFKSWPGLEDFHSQALIRRARTNCKWSNEMLPAGHIRRPTLRMGSRIFR